MSESDRVCRSVRLVALALAALQLASMTQQPASAETDAVAGAARVIDGDTLEIGGVRIRLEGIDAPETAQTCGRETDGTWSCGLAAAKALGRLVAGRRIDCASRGTDTYGRMLGHCRTGDLDLNAEMVRTGMAWAFVKYSTSYVDVENVARTQKLGVWQGLSEPAWAFREKRWAEAEVAAPEGCAIKGNISSNGRIYHAPWSAWYGKVKVEPARGERWFCSEAQAREAGFRPALSH